MNIKNLITAGLSLVYGVVLFATPAEAIGNCSKPSGVGLWANYSSGVMISITKKALYPACK